MEVSLKTLIIASTVILVSGLAIGRFTLPAKVVTKTQIQIQTQEVVKVQTQYVQTKDANKDYIRTETKQPDGTIVIKTEIVDKSITHTDDEKVTNDMKSSNTTVTQDKTITFAKNDWHISALASPSGDNKLLNSSLAYGAHVERRIIGPFYLGAFGLSNNTMGLSVGVSF
jgi:hypothetical protein